MSATWTCPRRSAFTRSGRRLATLALYRHETPLEYGLVLTDGQGRVERFVEKPGWGQVFTDQINTGIYVLSPAAMDRVPQGGGLRLWKGPVPRPAPGGSPPVRSAPGGLLVRYGRLRGLSGLRL